ncbi:Protein of unknown function [Pyronema omphalodes CBS 100304]|uniref:Uncharacterized protein n=1 Tax=Pyronema omphalodes (strain CBS 100304) TaxID=1076935 RepID=U4L2A9_PYROM|nr:Protein of unknown function [Pyronema omphalodes CBS 100304]
MQSRSRVTLMDRKVKHITTRHPVELTFVASSFGIRIGF